MRRVFVKDYDNTICVLEDFLLLLAMGVRPAVDSIWESMLIED